MHRWHVAGPHMWLSSIFFRVLHIFWMVLDGYSPPLQQAFLVFLGVRGCCSCSGCNLNTKIVNTKWSVQVSKSSSSNVLRLGLVLSQGTWKVGCEVLCCTGVECWAGSANCVLEEASNEDIGVRVSVIMSDAAESLSRLFCWAPLSKEKQKLSVALPQTTKAKRWSNYICQFHNWNKPCCL